MASPAALDAGKLQAEILRALLKGRASDLTVLQQDGTSNESRRAWDELIRRGAVVVDRSGKIVAAYPLSAVQTKHRVEVGTSTTWANCAIDALAVPYMVGLPGRIISQCAYCGAEIIIEVEGVAVRGIPDDAVVGYGGLAGCCDRPAIETRCPYINFFCDSEHADSWARPASWVGEFLPLPQAAITAINRFRPTIDAYRSVFSPESSLQG